MSPKSPTGRWLLTEPDPRAPARLLCFPFAGVGASALRQWPHRLGDLEVCRVQLPGRENRMGEPAYQDFDTFAREAADALAPALDRPYALFGHCMGALLAYALTEELARRGESPPVRLFVSSSLVPHRGFFGPFHPAMSDERLADELRKIARSIGQDEPLPELLPLAIRVLRKDVSMCYGYAPPGPRPLPCPVTTIGWADDGDVRPDRMSEWADYAPVRHHVLAGDEFTFLTAPPSLFEVIRRDFTDTGTGTGGATHSASDAGTTGVGA